MLLAVETHKLSVAVGSSVTEQGAPEFRLFSPPQFLCVEAQVCAVHKDKFLLKASFSYSRQLTFLSEPWAESFAPETLLLR